MSNLMGGTALIVGVDQYSDGIRPLHSAANDAQQLGATLRDVHGYQTFVLLDAAATAAAILETIATTVPKARHSERPFVLYFAGHGVARGDGTDGAQGYLLPFDARRGDENTWISMTRLRDLLEALPSRHMLVILDCCFAGSFRWAATRDWGHNSGPLYDSQYERYKKGLAWQALTSASHDEKALDVSPGGNNTRDTDTANSHSPFAAALLRGLAGAADSSRGGHEPDGVITATELFQYVFEELVPPGAPSHQTPGIWPLRPDNTGEFIFLNPAREKNTRPDPPLDDDNNPWLGLSAYSDNDAPLFFGREQIVTEVLERIEDQTRPRLVAIVGASGTGKSSVARAGVLPQLTTDEWHIVQSSRLDDNPLQGLEAAISGVPSGTMRKLLFIDQFEELYTQCRDDARRDAYLRKLTALINNDETLSVLVTLRSDFEPRPAAHAALAGMWDAGRIVVPAFSAEELRDCIEGPARVRALYFDPPSLVGTLVDEVMAMPGALPLLSFALSEMYQRARQRRRDTGSTDRALTHDDYLATGGVIGALHRRATDLYVDSEPAVQATIRRVFLRMLAQDGARLTRRRIHRDELEFEDAAEQARVGQVISDYVGARLLVTDAGDIEPAHDTLIVAWDKVVEWLSQAGPQNLIRSVWRAATDWRDSDQDAGLSWHDDPRLPLALSQSDQLNALERRFVAASEDVRKQRIRRLIGVSVAVGAAVVGAAIVALWQWRVALGQQTLAEQRLARSQSSALLAHAQAQTDPLLKAVVVAHVKKAGLPQPPRAAPVARQAFEGMLAQSETIPRDAAETDIRRRDNRDSVAYRLLQGMREFDTFAFEPRVFQSRPDRDDARDARYMQNERSVVVWFRDGSASYWPDPFQTDAMVDLGDAMLDIAASSSGLSIVIATPEDARVFEVNPDTGAATVQPLPGADVVTVAMDGSGEVVATGATNGRVAVYSVGGAAPLFETTLDAPVTHVALDALGQTLAVATSVGATRTWRVPAGTELSGSGRCPAPIEDLTLAPGGQVVAAVCSGQAWLWPASRLDVGRQLDSGPMKGVRFVSWPGSFAHDGLWLLGLPRSADFQLWPVVTATAAEAPTAPANQVLDPLVASGEPTRLYDSASGDFTVAKNIDAAVTATLINPDDEPQVEFAVTDAASGRTLTVNPGGYFGQPPDQFFVYHDEARQHFFAVASDGAWWSAALFDFGEPDADSAVQTLTGTLFNDAALSPDGKLLIVVSDLMNPNIIADDPKVYRTDSLQRVTRTLDGQRYVRDVAFSGDGQRIATTDCRGETRIWNRDGWNEPIVLRAATEDAANLCDPPSDSDRVSVAPVSWFSSDDQLVFTRLGDAWPHVAAIGYDTLAQLINEHTYVCLTPEQREQYFGETTDEAVGEYAACMQNLTLTER